MHCRALLWYNQPPKQQRQVYVTVFLARQELGKTDWRYTRASASRAKEPQDPDPMPISVPVKAMGSARPFDEAREFGY